MIYALFAFAFLIALLNPFRMIGDVTSGKIVGWLPITVLLKDHSSNATNYPSHIVVKQGIARQAAIQCQERAEWGFKWKRGYWPVIAIKKLHREMELLGQTVEMVVERDFGTAPWEEHLWNTSHQLTRYPQFRGITVEQHRAAILATVPKAEAWVAKHRSYVQRALQH